MFVWRFNRSPKVTLSQVPSAESLLSNPSDWGTRSRNATSPKGESVLKYGQIIGVALERIEAGSLSWRRGVCALDDRTHSLEGSTAAVYKIWSAVTCHRFSSDS